VVRPASKLATTSWWSDTTLVSDLGLDEVGTDEAYAAMDWLLSRQDAIEMKLAQRHLAPAANPLVAPTSTSPPPGWRGGSAIVGLRPLS